MTPDVRELLEECQRHRATVTQADRDVVQALLECGIGDGFSAPLQQLVGRSGWSAAQVGITLRKLEDFGALVGSRSTGRATTYRWEPGPLGLLRLGPSVEGPMEAPPRSGLRALVWFDGERSAIVESVRFGLRRRWVLVGEVVGDVRRWMPLPPWDGGA